MLGLGRLPERRDTGRRTIARPAKGGSLSTSDNKALIRRFYEQVWDQGNTDFAYEVFADDYVRHDLRPTAALPGPEGQRKIADDFRSAFPDLRVNVDLVVGGDDYVVGRWTASGTHTGSWSGIPPTGRHATFSAATSSASKVARSRKSGTTATTSAFSNRLGHRSTPVRPNRSR